MVTLDEDERAETEVELARQEAARTRQQLSASEPPVAAATAMQPPAEKLLPDEESGWVVDAKAI